MPWIHDRKNIIEQLEHFKPAIADLNRLNREIIFSRSTWFTFGP
jgi:hypothetical protein